MTPQKSPKQDFHESESSKLEPSPKQKSAIDEIPTETKIDEDIFNSLKILEEKVSLISDDPTRLTNILSLSLNSPMADLIRLLSGRVHWTRYLERDGQANVHITEWRPGKNHSVCQSANPLHRVQYDFPGSDREFRSTFRERILGVWSRISSVEINASIREKFQFSYCLCH
jgi:hypothetical protein